MTAQKLWTAVERRDPAADGLFVYAVRSTGIYCRPTCASRRPNRDRVEFFPAPAMAEAEGYRACRRCHPDSAAPPGTNDAVRLVCERVARHPEARWASATLARAGGTTVTRLQRSFKRTLGLSPREYVAACRRRKFFDTLRNGRKVTDAIYEAGYGSPSRVYGEAVTLPGMTPATYGRGGAGATIEWMTTPTRVGLVLVAATPKGLCYVAIGSRESELRRSLDAEFPRAEIAPRQSTRLRALADAVRRIASAQPVPTDLPIDVIGTAFQWKVWRALADIPLGETRSYSEVAALIGRPSATRAVARACATNPIPLVVPCHRVVGRDGSVTGYRWGTNVKSELLAAEKE